MMTIFAVSSSPLIVFRADVSVSIHFQVDKPSGFSDTQISAHFGSPESADTFHSYPYGHIVQFAHILP